MAAFFRQDLANVYTGIYPLPAGRYGRLPRLLWRSWLLFQALPNVHRRREINGHDEVLTEEVQGRQPRSFLQNFRFQSGGWITEDSAERYATEVEVLFNHSASAIPGSRKSRWETQDVSRPRFAGGALRGEIGQ
jgi:hypothetical protein